MTTTAAAANDLVRLLLDVGFDENLVKSNYKVTVAGNRSRADVVGFGQAPADMATAVVVGEVTSASGDIVIDRSMGIARSLAAPALVIARQDRTEFINTRSGRVVQSLRSGESVSDQLRTELDPRNLLAAKRQERQMSLFSVGVSMLSTARRDATERLADRVLQARSIVDQSLNPAGLSTADTYELSAQLLTDGLTSLFIEDKFGVPFNSEEWWTEADSRFAQMASALRSHNDEMSKLFLLVRDELRDGIDYHSLDSVVVADLYEPRLVTSAARDELGVVYTPHELATEVLARIPIELIEPHNRHVWDLACGSGTLLLASHDRLSDAAPQHASASLSPSALHDYLLGHIHGSDRDPFAVRLAHLSLSLHGFPQSNGWDVTTSDSTAKPPTVTPHIVFANPPWKSTRSAPDADGVPRRQDQVVPFINRALDLLPPGGLLGMFVPASTLDGDYAAPVRERLSAETDVLEVWRLPENAFPGAKVRGAVVIAQVRQPGASRTTHQLQRRIGPSDRQSAKGRRPRSVAQQTQPKRGSEAPTHRRYVIDTPAETPQGGEHWGTTSATTRYIDGLRSLVGSQQAVTQPAATSTDSVDQPGWTLLSDWFDLRTGPTTSRKTAASRKTAGEQPFLHLLKVRRLVQFAEITAAAVPSSPSSLAAGAGWDFDARLAHDKLLVSRVARAGQPWRLAVYFTFEPVVPSNNQYALTLKAPTGDRANDQATLAAMGAILNSALINAWVDWSTPGNVIRRSLLEQLPLPPSWRSLGPQALESVTRFDPENPETPSERARRAETLRKLSDRVSALYAIPADVADDLDTVLTGFRDRSGLIWNPSAPPPCVNSETADHQRRDGHNATWASAAVLDIRRGEPLIWIDGVTEPDGEYMPWWPTLPGATLLPDCAFLAGIDHDARPTGDVRFHINAYKNADQLLDLWAAVNDD